MRGGTRTGAGRKLGVPDPHHSPEATRALLDPHRHPGESWASLARRIGVNRRSVSRALVHGGTVRQVGVWVLRLTNGDGYLGPADNANDRSTT